MKEFISMWHCGSRGLLQKLNLIQMSVCISRVSHNKRIHWKNVTLTCSFQAWKACSSGIELFKGWMDCQPKVWLFYFPKRTDLPERSSWINMCILFTKVNDKLICILWWLRSFVIGHFLTKQHQLKYITESRIYLIKFSNLPRTYKFFRACQKPSCFRLCGTYFSKVNIFVEFQEAGIREYFLWNLLEFEKSCSTTLVTVYSKNFAPMFFFFAYFALGNVQFTRPRSTWIRNSRNDEYHHCIHVKKVSHRNILHYESYNNNGNFY